MGLNGNLEDMPLQDILQIIHHSQKSGTLFLTGPNGEGTVVFRDGTVVQSFSPTGRIDIGKSLMEGGQITEAVLSKAITLQNQNSLGQRLGSILVEMGAVEFKDIEDVVSQQIQSALNVLLSWREGSFNLVLEAVPTYDEISVALDEFTLPRGMDTQHLLLEALRTWDEQNRDASGAPAQAEASSGIDEMPEAEPSSVLTGLTESFADIQLDVPLDSPAPAQAPRLEDEDAADVTAESPLSTLAEEESWEIDDEVGGNGTPEDPQSGLDESWEVTDGGADERLPDPEKILGDVTSMIDEVPSEGSQDEDLLSNLEEEPVEEEPVEEEPVEEEPVEEEPVEEEPVEEEPVEEEPVEEELIPRQLALETPLVIIVPEEELTSSMFDHFRKMGFPVEVTPVPADGINALPLLSTSGRRPTIILDPEACKADSTLEFIAELRTVAPSSPIIVISNDSSPELASRLYGAGVRNVLRKPDTDHTEPFPDGDPGAALRNGE